jgi:hypothetical protein
MNADKLVFITRKPFDMFVNLPSRPEWLPVLYSIRKDCQEEVIELTSHMAIIRRDFGLAA